MKKDLIITIIAAIVFIAYSYNLIDILAQNPIWLSIGGYGVVGAGFIFSLLRLIKKL
jgi:hypothetical protein